MKKTALKRKTSRIKFTEPSMTQQHFKDECDINNILRRHENGLPVTHIMSSQGQYGDFSAIPEYQDSLNLVNDAQTAFMALPSHVRARFGHDPSQLIAFVSDKANREEAIKLGLVPAPAVSTSNEAPPKGDPKADAPVKNAE